MAGFDKGTPAMAQIGLTGAGQKPARSPDSARAIAPYQIPPLRLLTASPVAFPTVEHIDAISAEALLGLAGPRRRPVRVEPEVTVQTDAAPKGQR